MPASRRFVRSGLVASTTLALVLTFASANADTKNVDPADGGGGDRFGEAVALDGDTLVVGAPYKTGGGAAYVFTRSAGETWTQTSKLYASDGVAGDRFGASVAIDGGTIVVGAPGDDDGRGSLYLFSEAGTGSRTQADHLIVPGQAKSDGLGESVAVDGDTIVAGAPGWDNGVVDEFGDPYDAGYGAVYTFATAGTAGRGPTARLTASDNTITGYIFGGSRLGTAVGIDGSTIVAGAPSDLRGNPSGNRYGAVYTFARIGSNRTETAKLTSGNQPGYLGQAVAIDGDIIVAGDNQADGAQGAAYVFATTGGAARGPIETLTATPNRRSNMDFGGSIAIGGGFIVVGAKDAPGGSSYPNSTGATYVFTRTGAPGRAATWYTSAADNQNAQVYATSIATDGKRVIGGAPSVDAFQPDFQQDRGRVYSSTPYVFVSPTGTGTGKVTSSPSGFTNCSSSCEASFLLGDEVTITATPNPGSYFAGWENWTGCTGTAPCTFTVTGSPQIAARFTAGTPPTDTTPPTVSFSSGPGAGMTVTTTTATFGFSANESSTFRCAYDSEAFVPCTSPGPGTTGSDTRSGLTQGPHTFRVTGTDTFGNTSVALTRSFTVSTSTQPPADTTKPQTTITAAPKKVKTTKRKATVTISFRSSEAGTFLCSVDGGAAKPCGSPASFKLRIGTHTLVVTAVDRAGNRDATPASVVVKVKKKKK